jgi:hypothetical protein
MAREAVDQNAVNWSLRRIWGQVWDQIRTQAGHIEVRDQVASKIPCSGLVQVRNQVWFQATEEVYGSKRRA